MADAKFYDMPETVPWTDERYTRFLIHFSRTGSVTESARKAKLPRQNVYEMRNRDTVFARVWEDARANAIELLEAEARRRAMTGVLDPVYQGGKMAGRVRRYSDTLLIVLLKANNPEKYRENYHLQHAGDGGGAQHTVQWTVDEWKNEQEQRRQQAAEVSEMFDDEK